MPLKNTQRRAAFIWLFIGAAGIFMVFMPGLFEIDMLNGGGALIFIGIFVAISGIVVSILFFKRAKLMDNVFLGDKYLIHWRYGTYEWDQYAEKEFEYRKGANKSLFALMGSLCIIVGIIFWIIDHDGGKYVFIVMIAMTFILAITAVLTAVLPYRHNKNNVGEVYIFNDGLYINGKTHIWKGFTARLESVDIDVKNNLLKFTYSFISRAGRQNYTVLVPIPGGEIQNAQNIVNHFK